MCVSVYLCVCVYVRKRERKGDRGRERESDPCMAGTKGKLEGEGKEKPAYVSSSLSALGDSSSNSCVPPWPQLLGRHRPSLYRCPSSFLGPGSMCLPLSVHSRGGRSLPLLLTSGAPLFPVWLLCDQLPTLNSLCGRHLEHFLPPLPQETPPPPNPG